MQPSMTDLIRIVVISPVVPAWMDPTTLIAPEQKRTEAVRKPFAKLCVVSECVMLPSLSPRENTLSSILSR